MKNLIILYPGGAGGNHLANLISTSIEGIFRPRVESSDYLQSLLENYKNKSNLDINNPTNDPITNFFRFNAHLSTKGNNDLDHIIDNLEKLSDTGKINILCGHLTHFVVYYDYLKDLKDVKYIIISIKNPNEILSKRLAPAGNPWVKEYLMRENSYYTEPVITKLAQTSPDRVFTINGNLIFNENLTDLKQCLRNFFNINLPPEADILHDIWFNQLIKKFYS